MRNVHVRAAGPGPEGAPGAREIASRNLDASQARLSSVMATAATARELALTVERRARPDPSEEPRPRSARTDWQRPEG